MRLIHELVHMYNGERHIAIQQGNYELVGYYNECINYLLDHPNTDYEKQFAETWKTEYCVMHFKSVCRCGSDCSFAHHPLELRVRKRHKNYKTKECVTFRQYGFCPYGLRCNFIHKIS